MSPLTALGVSIPDLLHLYALSDGRSTLSCILVFFPVDHGALVHTS